MKNKSSKHKSSNTFKFQPFLERISNIDVDVFHRIGHKYEDDTEEEGTYLNQALLKWNGLNLSESYAALRKELPAIQTLPQIVNKKEEVVAVLLRHLEQRNPLSLQPVLEMVVALARDLHQDFYPHYADFLQRLLALLQVKDTDVLEWTFTCLAYLFKFLWRCLVRDLGTVFNSLLPLLANNQPQYVNNFAAESFAFVARKIKDKAGFIGLILQALKSKKRDAVAGCGQLIFGVMRGVAGQFHSCADDLLPLLLSSLRNPQLDIQLLFKILSHTVDSILSNIHSKKAGLFWKSILATIEQFLNSTKTDSSEQSLCLVLQLVLQATKHGDAWFVGDPTSLVGVLVKVSESTAASSSPMQLVADIGVCLLLSRHIRMSQELCCRLLAKILATPHHHVVVNFVGKLLAYPGFEALILPQLLELCQNSVSSDRADTILQEDLLKLLTQLVVQKAPLCTSGMDLESWQPYPLDFSAAVRRLPNAQKVSFPQHLLDKITCCSSKLETDPVEVLCILICLPHIRPVDRYLVRTAVKNVLEQLCVLLNSWKPDTNSSVVLFELSIAVETAIHVTDAGGLKEVIDLDSLCSTLLPHLDNLLTLRTLNICLTAFDTEPEKEEVSEKVKDKLKPALLPYLSSPFHHGRLLVSHILSLLDSSPYAVFLAAEAVPATVQDYRKKLVHLQKLEYEVVQPLGTDNAKVALRYLLGVLYVNFKLLWDPVIKLVASHARGMAMDDFWEVFGQQVSLAAHHAREPPLAVKHLDKQISWEYLSKLLENMVPTSDNPDYPHYRELLWEALAQFPDVAEKKTRDLVPAFIQFVEEEYYRKNAEMAQTWSVKKSSVEKGAESEETRQADGCPLDDTDMLDVSGDVNNDIQAEGTKEDEQNISAKEVEVSDKENVTLDASDSDLQQKPAARVMNASKSLLAHLSVFSKLRNPRSAHLEPRLNSLYRELLSHRNAAVQRAALDCLVTYRYPFLLPYRPNLERLLDDRAFKAELTVFRIDHEEGLVQPEHRAGLMPIVMSMLHSKMLTSTAKETGQSRRTHVLRFLAGCSEEERMAFVRMAFTMFHRFIEGEDVKMVTNSLMHDVNLDQVFPPRRLRSTLSLVRVIMEQFGGLMGHSLLSFLLRIVLCVGAMVAGILDHRESVHPGYLTILRDLRSTSTEIISRFFERFETYPWTESELDAVFSVFVWPWIEKLPIEGIHSPTALLKLFAVWSKNPRYFILLAKHKLENPAVSPLPFIMKLLLGNKTHTSVTATIWEMVEQLLSLHEEDGEEEEGNKHLPLPVSSTVSIDTETVSKLKVSERLNMGSQLLLPHVLPILERLRRKLERPRSRGLSTRELSVLSRVSELVVDGEASDALLRLLVPVVARRGAVGEPLVASLVHLASTAPSPERYLRPLAPLFSSVTSPGPRKLLCDLLLTMGGKKASLAEGAQLVSELNAWDKRWVEQPDYIRRLDAFKRVHTLLAADSINVDMGVVIIHNCFHFIKTEKDMSLRDSAGYCLRKLAPKLCQQFQDSAGDIEFLVNTTLLQLIAKGIKQKMPVLRQESLTLLGEMARECPSVHPVLTDLSLFANKADPEIDFFENLQHLQLTRKSRALLRFCQDIKGLKVAPTPRTLTQFILPLASEFLCNEQYVNKHNAVDAAIEVVGVVCQLLPWHQYEAVLRFYLSKLRNSSDYQKQLVKLVVAILDAFHFDLSRAKEIPQITSDSLKNTNKTNEKAKEKHTGNQVQEVVGDEEPVKDDDGDDDNADVRTKTEAEEEDDLEQFIASSKVEDAVEDGAEEKMEEDEADKCLAVECVTILPRSAALRATKSISVVLLPQIDRAMVQRTQADVTHRLNRKQLGPDRDEEDLVRVPIALAAVKLLQRLPAGTLEHNLPGVISKLCTFLRSRMESVRRVARHTLQQIAVALGPAYVHFLLRELASLLTKGFQVHVLSFTMHSVLNAVQEQLKAGDLDSCLPLVLEVCQRDLFGATAEEKEVSQITGKVAEARSVKSYVVFSLLGQYLSEKCLMDMIMPLKDALARTHSHKVMTRVAECLRNAALGLVENAFVTPEALLIFSYGVMTESIPQLAPEPKRQLTEKQKEMMLRERPDSFIIPSAPRNRAGGATVARTSAHANSHVLIEFGLRVLHALLRKERVTDTCYLPFIDPLVSVLRNCLDSLHIKLTVLSLQCLGWVLKLELPSMNEHLKGITASIFKLLHKYASAGLSKGDNFNLVVAAFKTVTVLVRDVKNHAIDGNQLRALLLYAEQDVDDMNRQATAFHLLRAILGRRLVAPELCDVMEKVARLSITAGQPHVRIQSRQVFHKYLMDYPQGEKLEKHIAFYISQLNFAMRSGRESAMEMIHTIISTFPQEVLEEHGSVLFVALGARLENDDVPECRTMAAQCIKTLLLKLESSSREKLFEVTMVWFSDKKLEHRRLAAQLCGLFVVVEKEAFATRLATVLPVILQQFNWGAGAGIPGRFVRAVPDAPDSDSERATDHHLVQVLQLLLKVLEHCPRVLRSSSWSDEVITVAESAQTLLAHPHEWVRLGCTQVLGFVFGSLDASQVAAASYNQQGKGFLLSHSRKTVKSLVLDLCAQLQPGELNPALVEQVVKNLVFLGRVLKDFPPAESRAEPRDEDEEDDDADEEEDGNKTKVSLSWMIRRMRRIVYMEIVQSPHSTDLRTAVFRWIGAMAVDLGVERLPPYLSLLLAPLVRELTSVEGEGTPLYRLAKQVATVLKKKVGMDEYTRAFTELQLRLSSRRAQRKKIRAQQVITEPDLAAKRKIRLQQKKKENRKRKMDELKGRKIGPKRFKKKKIADDDDT